MKTWTYLILIFTTMLVWGAGSADRDTPTYSVTFKESGGSDTITMKPGSTSTSYSLFLPTAVATVANSPLLSSTGGVLSYGVGYPTSVTQGGLAYATSTGIAFSSAGTASDWALSGGTGATTFSSTTTTPKMIDGSTDAVQLTVQSHSTQTSNPFELQDSSGGVTFKYVQATGNVINTRGSTGGASFDGRTSSGTVSTPAVSANGNTTAIFRGWGYSGAAADYVQAGAITISIDGTPDSGADPSDMPGKLNFQTTADGSGSPTARMSINSSGIVAVSTTDDSTSSTTGSVTTAGGLGVAKSLYVGGTTNQLGAAAATPVGYVGLSGNIANISSGTGDTNKGIRIGANSYFGASNGPARTTNISGGDIQIVGRTSDTTTTMAFNVSKISDGVTVTASEVMGITGAGKVTIGVSGGSQTHDVNGALSVSSTTDATTTTAASLKTLGGIAAVKNIISGADIFSLDSTGQTAFQFNQSTSSFIAIRAANPPSLNFERSNNTRASPTVTVNGNTLGITRFYGYDGSSYQEGASIYATADGNSSAGSMPTYLAFQTTASGAVGSSLRMTINASGSVGIGPSLPINSAILDIQSTTLPMRLPRVPTGTLPSGSAGMFAYDSTLNALTVHNGTAWMPIHAGNPTLTLTNLTNLDSSGFVNAYYIRVFNIVSFGLRVSIDPTAATSTTMGVSLPIASNLIGTSDVSGVCGDGVAAVNEFVLDGDGTNNRMTLTGVAATTSSFSLWCTGHYIIY